MNLYVFFSAVLGTVLAAVPAQRGVEVEAFLVPQKAQRRLDTLQQPVSSSEAILARPHEREVDLAHLHPNAHQLAKVHHKKHHQQSVLVHAKQERASEDQTANGSAREVESIKSESQAEGRKLATDFQKLSSCASNGDVIYSIPAVQYTENQANDLPSSSLATLLNHLAPLVDMAYVLCMDCDSIKFFKGVENIRLVSGSASDKCSEIPDQDILDHHRRVAFAHKAAVAYSQMNEYARILIAEEDATINQLPDLAEFEKQVEMHWTENSHQLIRLTALPTNWPPGTEVFDESGSCKTENCKCRIGRDEMFCTLKQGCPQIHDSSLYMIAQPAYAAFMDNEEILDTDMFASFDSVLATTPISFQNHQTTQAHAWDMYRNACVE